MTGWQQDDQTEPFFITEDVAAEMIASGYPFEPPPIACTLRLCDVLAAMDDAVSCCRALSGVVARACDIADRPAVLRRR